MNERVRAWYFLPADRRLANGDGREIRVGRWSIKQVTR